jgi:hypothetical protein
MFNTSSEMLSNCFFEILAYYQFLVLIYLANILDLTDRSLSLYGHDLNVVYGQIAKDDAKLGLLIGRAITDYQFHNLVSSYLSGDKSISGLSDESFVSLLKFLGFEKYHDDFINRSLVVSYSRILKVLGCSYGDRDIPDIDIMLPTWYVHSSATINFKKLLAIKFKKSFPNSVEGYD